MCSVFLTQTDTVLEAVMLFNVDKGFNYQDIRLIKYLFELICEEVITVCFTSLMM